jgi:hypothetical protein
MSKGKDDRKGLVDRREEGKDDEQREEKLVPAEGRRAEPLISPRWASGISLSFQLPTSSLYDAIVGFYLT